MIEKYRVPSCVKFEYSEIGEYIGEGYTDRVLQNYKIVDLLNEQEEMIKRLKQIIEEQTETILKQKRKMQELETRNKRQCNLFDEITDLMFERDWESLEKIVDDWEESDRLLHAEEIWKDCGDAE